MFQSQRSKSGLEISPQKRSRSLLRLLESLNDAIYDEDKVKLEVRIDRSVHGSFDEETVKTAKAFSFKHGVCEVIPHLQHAGILGQWLSSWKPTRNSSEISVICEDDVTVSKYFYKYLKIVHRKYDNYSDINGYALQGLSKKHDQTDTSLLSGTNGSLVFLYPVVGSWGFSPCADNWIHFYECYMSVCSKENRDLSTPNRLSNSEFGQLGIYITLISTLNSLFTPIYQTRQRNKVYVPDSIVQYGLGGTATTLQFQIICLLMALFHVDEVNKVGCYYSSNQLHKYCVIKTHFIKYSFLQRLLSDAWVFMTSCKTLSDKKKEELEYNKRKIKNMKIKISFTADVEMVSKRGHTIIIDYLQYFALSETQKEHAIEYMRYWGILRLCCGKQMSADWRKHLTPSATFKNCTMTKIVQHILRVKCISEVEKLLIKTYVYQHFANISSLRDII